MKSDSSLREIRFTVNEDFLNELERRLGVSRSTDVAKSALSLLDWASNEVARGRVILSSSEDGEDVHRLVMAELSAVKK